MALTPAWELAPKSAFEALPGAPLGVAGGSVVSNKNRNDPHFKTSLHWVWQIDAK
jgi:hypothetical protein